MYRLSTFHFNLGFLSISLKLWFSQETTNLNITSKLHIHKRNTNIWEISPILFFIKSGINAEHKCRRFTIDVKTIIQMLCFPNIINLHTFQPPGNQSRIIINKHKRKNPLMFRKEWNVNCEPMIYTVLPPKLSWTLIQTISDTQQEV